MYVKKRFKNIAFSDYSCPPRYNYREDWNMTKMHIPSNRVQGTVIDYECSEGSYANAFTSLENKVTSGKITCTKDSNGVLEWDPPNVELPCLRKKKKYYHSSLIFLAFHILI